MPSLSTMTFIDAQPSPSRRRVPVLTRNVVIAIFIVLFHVLALWAFQSGLLRRAVAVFVPVEVISEVVEPPRPVVPPPPVPSPPTVTKQVVKIRAPTPPPAPQLQAVPNPEPTPNAPTAVNTPPAPLPPIAAPVTVSEAPVASPPAPSRVELPSRDAEYLQNPKPAYPPMSRRLGEQGTVLIQVLIGTDGNAQKGEIKKSSGFARLDQAALTTVLKWRYVPGKRAGVVEAMWFTVPIAFALE
jgi:protein TonB